MKTLDRNKQEQASHDIDVNNLVFSSDGTACLNLERKETREKVWNVIQKLRGFPLAVDKA